MTLRRHGGYPDSRRRRRLKSSSRKRRVHVIDFPSRTPTARQHIPFTIEQSHSSFNTISMQAFRQTTRTLTTKPILTTPIRAAFSTTRPAMSTQGEGSSASFSAADRDNGTLKIENTNINTAPGVSLSDSQQKLVGSVLDLFAGRPSLAKLALWKDDGLFTDPLTIAQGRKQYEAQWYGLQTAFSEIERLSHEVTSSGNPITMNLSTRYVVKGIGKEQKIDSIIEIHTEGDKIAKVADKWNGKLPTSSFTQVRSFTSTRSDNAFILTRIAGLPTAQRCLCTVHCRCTEERKGGC